MYLMNWSVLLVKLLTCLLICRSREITSPLIKGAIIGYLVLMPFADEVYSNVTNLQWWLIPLMAVIIIRHESGKTSLAVSAVILILTGLTGVNSVMFALPCAYLILKDRSPACVIKNSVVILCGAVQLYFLLSTGRGSAGSMAFEGGMADLICIFVKRVIFHTLFKSDAPLLLSITVLAAFIALAALNLRRYRKLRAVQFIALFSAVYTAVIFYNLMKSEKDPEVLLSTLLLFTAGLCDGSRVTVLSF